MSDNQGMSGKLVNEEFHEISGNLNMVFLTIPYVMEYEYMTLPIKY